MSAGDSIDDRGKPPATWLRGVARLGYGTRGALYILFGSFAAWAAVTGGAVHVTRSAVEDAAARFPTAIRVVLMIIAVGVFAYALWRLAQALFDVDRTGNPPSWILLKLGFVGTAAFYILFGIVAIEMALGRVGDGGSGRWLAWILAHAFGRFVVGVTSFAIMILAFIQFRVAWSVAFRKWVALEDLGPRMRWTIIWVSRVGLCGRGVLFGGIAWFIGKAAVTTDPRDFKGIEGTLQAWAARPGGTALLGGAAACLILFGLYLVATARLRVFPRRPADSEEAWQPGEDHHAKPETRRQSRMKATDPRKAMRSR